MAHDEPKNGVARCSFCGKPETLVHKLIEGPGVFICDECINLCYDLIEQTSSPDIPHTVKQSDNKVLPKPEEIKAKLDEYVIGQDDAKVALYIITIKEFTLMYVAMLSFKRVMLCFWVRPVLVKPCLRKRLPKFLMFRLLLQTQPLLPKQAMLAKM